MMPPRLNWVLRYYAGSYCLQLLDVPFALWLRPPCSRCGQRHAWWHRSRDGAAVAQAAVGQA